MAYSSNSNSAAAIAAKQRLLIAAKNIQVAKYFSIFFGCYLFLFILFHFGSRISHVTTKTHPTATAIFTYPARLFRPFLLLKVPMYDSLGHAVTIFIYFIVLVVLSVSVAPGLPIDSTRNWFSRRLGWISLFNIVAAIIFSIKNTPLAFLVGYSHQRLNVLHRTAGVTSIICFILHFAIYTASTVKQKHTEYLTTQEQIHGYAAGGILLVFALIGFRPFRQRFYELFIKLHTIGYLAILINIVLHKPEVIRQVIWIVVFAASCYVASRSLRLIRMVYNSWGNSATLIAMDGATKIVLDKPLSATPGSHVFITIPAIRPFESHPFTISDISNTQFRVRKRAGFTAALFRYAEKNPGAKVRILLDGPFGATPDFKSFDKVMLVAGGVGATFGFSQALDIVRSPNWAPGKVARMLWIIQTESHMDWFTDELNEIRRSDRIDLTVFITRPGVVRQESTSSSSRERDFEKAGSLEKGAVPAAVLLEEKATARPEYASGRSSSDDLSPIQKEDGKPDIKAAIGNMIKSADRTDRVIFSVCGPAKLMDAVRNTVAKSITLGGPSITLQSEQFGF